MEKYGKVGQTTHNNKIVRMRLACWITKDNDTHSEHVIILAFSRQKWLRERTSSLRYTYVLLNNNLGGTQSNHWALKG